MNEKKLFSCEYKDIRGNCKLNKQAEKCAAFTHVAVAELIAQCAQKEPEALIILTNVSRGATYEFPATTDEVFDENNRKSNELEQAMLEHIFLVNSCFSRGGDIVSQCKDSLEHNKNIARARELVAMSIQKMDVEQLEEMKNELEKLESFFDDDSRNKLGNRGANFPLKNKLKVIKKGILSREQKNRDYLNGMKKKSPKEKFTESILSYPNVEKILDRITIIKSMLDLNLEEQLADKNMSLDIIEEQYLNELKKVCKNIFSKGTEEVQVERIIETYNDILDKISHFVGETLADSSEED